MQAKGGSFVGDNKDFFRFRLGERAVIPAFEEAVQTMRVRARRAAVCYTLAGDHGASKKPGCAACSLRAGERRRWAAYGASSCPLSWATQTTT